MNKKNYQKPAIQVVCLNTSILLRTGSGEVNRTTNNAGFNEEITGGSEVARGRSFNVWDEEEQ